LGDQSQSLLENKFIFESLVYNHKRKICDLAYVSLPQRNFSCTHLGQPASTPIRQAHAFPESTELSGTVSHFYT